MPVYFSEIDINTPIRNKRLLKSWINAVATKHGKNLKELSVVFCSDEYLLSLNNEYLNSDYLTDVISFDYSSGNHLSGDIFVSMDRIRENAVKLGIDIEIEMRRIIIHGVLHIVGYSDKTKAQKTEMTNLENQALALYPQDIKRD